MATVERTFGGDKTIETRGPSPIPRELDVLGTTRGQTEKGEVFVEVTLRVPEDLLYFSGHFQGDPVLPGVVQIANTALAQVERCWPDLGRLESVKRLKFIHIIRPADTIVLRLVRRSKPGRRTIAMTISRDETTLCTSGVLTFSPGGPS